MRTRNGSSVLYKTQGEVMMRRRKKVARVPLTNKQPFIFFVYLIFFFN